MKKLIEKESAAWREVARRIAEGEWSGWGICDVLTDLMYGGGCNSEAQISYATYDIMIARICSARDEAGTPTSGYKYIWPTGEKDERVLYCLFVALLAEDEGD